VVAGLVSLPIPAFYYFKNKELIRRPAEILPMRVVRSNRRVHPSYSDLIQSDRNVLDPNNGLYGDPSELDTPEKQSSVKPLTTSTMFHLAA